MSDLLSAQLIREIEQEIDDNINENDTIGDIEVKYEIICGKRENSQVIWAYEEECAYYKNSLSKKTGNEACKCVEKGCNARIYIREDDTAFKYCSTDHNHGSMYSSYFKYAYCLEKMRQKAKYAMASVSAFDIFSEVLLE